MLSKLKFEGEYLNGNIIEGKGYDDLNNMTLLIEKDGKGKEFFFYRVKFNLNGNI